MLFMMAYMFIFIGVFLAGLFGLMPAQMQLDIPDALRMIMFMFGFLLAFVGVFLIQGRALKTGVNHLLEYGNPKKIIWFYVYRDGTIKITPAMRDVEGLLYSKELDAAVQDMKSYRLFDHSIRFVPEAIGHAADLDMCLYAHVLKTKWGFNNIITARDGGRIANLASSIKKKNVVETKEYMTSGKELDDLRGVEQ